MGGGRIVSGAVFRGNASLQGGRHHALGVHTPQSGDQYPRIVPFMMIEPTRARRGHFSYSILATTTSLINAKLTFRMLQLIFIWFGSYVLELESSQ